MYKFKKSSGVEARFRQIALSQLDAITSELAGAGINNGEAIHAVRKRCKKLRGLLQLVRPAFRAFRTENLAIRDAANLLSGARDAQVLVETFEHYVTPHGEGVDIFAETHRRLRDDYEALKAEESHADALEEFNQSIAALQKRASHWSLEQTGFKAVSGGLKSTYADARKGLARAHADPQAEVFHDWRKAVKYHGYHLRLLGDLAPDLLKLYQSLDEELGEILGDHHNLAVLADAIGEADATTPIARIIAMHQEELSAQAFVIGQQIFAERPQALVERFKTYWNV